MSAIGLQIKGRSDIIKIREPAVSISNLSPGIVEKWLRSIPNPEARIHQLGSSLSTNWGKEGLPSIRAVPFSLITLSARRRQISCATEFHVPLNSELELGLGKAWTRARGNTDPG